jgi:SagB-type dehydrogenase family enzyme
MRKIFQMPQILRRIVLPAGAALLAAAWLFSAPGAQAAAEGDAMGAGTDRKSTIELPEPRTRGSVSLEQSLAARRSVRRYSENPLELEQTGQLLWAAQGITSRQGFRTAPSAGALYPLEIYAVVGQAAGLEPGIYRYGPRDHQLKLRKEGVHTEALCRAALSQSAVCDAPLCLVITGVMARTTGKYGKRGVQYVFLEAGHAAQNVLLQAAAMGLGAVPVGAFKDGAVSRLLELEEGEEPLYILPVGRPD